MQSPTNNSLRHSCTLIKFWCYVCDFFSQSDKVSDHPSHPSLAVFHFFGCFLHFRSLEINSNHAQLYFIVSLKLTCLVFTKTPPPPKLSFTIMSFISFDNSLFLFVILTVFIRCSTGYRLLPWPYKVPPLIHTPTFSYTTYYAQGQINYASLSNITIEASEIFDSVSHVFCNTFGHSVY